MPRPRRLRRTVLPLLLAGSLTVLAACQDDDVSSPANQGWISGDGVIEQVAVGERKQLGRVAGTTLHGDEFDSDDHRGTVMVYNVWGSWCPPCRKEAPGLQRVSEEYADQGVRFVGIDVKDNRTAALAFERRYGITYPSIDTTRSSEALLAFSGTLPPNAVPSTIVTDRQGRVAARVVGPTTYRTLSDLVDDALGKPTRR